MFNDELDVTQASTLTFVRYQWKLTSDKHRPWRLCSKKICSLDNGNPLKNHKAGLTPTTSVTSTTISPVKMSIGRKSPTDLHSEMIILQGKPVFYTFLPSTPPYWQIIFRFCWKSERRSRDIFRLSVVLGFYHCLTKHIWEFIFWRLVIWILNVSSVWYLYMIKPENDLKGGRCHVTYFRFWAAMDLSFSTKSEDYLSVRGCRW